jgi:hypothetical protein
MDDLAKNVAERIGNLALATTPNSLVSCMQSLEEVQDCVHLVIVLRSEDPSSGDPELALRKADLVMDELHSIPQVIYDNDSTINARVTTAMDLISPAFPRIVISLHPLVNAATLALTARDEQHIAIALLDALCLAFSERFIPQSDA